MEKNLIFLDYLRNKSHPWVSRLALALTSSRCCMCGPRDGFPVGGDFGYSAGVGDRGNVQNHHES